ncbi:MAG: PP2C family protein-serine/threonine phosphatase [Oscillospiraceae bacterium]|nr:PP2C family protein-serine/threonine phosphatase [Oscillospiraceae bacterium]
MGINETAIVSCYSDAAALLVMILLMLMSERFRRRKHDASLYLFYLLSLFLIATCVMSFLCHAAYKQTALWWHILAVGCRTLWEWFTFFIILLWSGYVAVKLHWDKKRLLVPAVLYALPFCVFTVLLIVNLFNGIIFSYSADNHCEYSWLYYLFIVIEAVFFTVPLILVRTYDTKGKKVRFLKVMPMIVPVGLGVIVQFFLPYQTDVLGFAIGAALLYFSMADEFRFQDAESGLYNQGFLTYFFDRAMVDKNIINSALILEADGYLPGCFEILRETLHQDYDVIRIEEKKFLMFSGTESRSMLQLLSTHVEEAVAKYNAEHPQEPVRITVHSRMRGKDEETFAFLRSVVEKRETGDPVLGVVSMISELDRLDEELKLAGDIQLNMLPMNFPAFPDRTEFDLYASMTPAKEVGGDFYDFFLVDRDHLALVIADVSGKGIPASLFMMVSKTLIKNQLMSGCDPAEALKKVNLQLCERNSSMMFVTVWLAVLELSTGKGMACNAGHEDPCLRRAGKDFELLKYKHGMFAGVMETARYQNREFELHPGDCIFVYTDGVPEANNAFNDMFGTERMIATLNEDPDASPEDLIRHTHNAVDVFAGGADQFDDITMLCLKYYGAREK